MRTFRDVFVVAVVVLLASLSARMSSNSQNLASRSLSGANAAGLVLKDAGDIKWGEGRAVEGLPAPAQVAVLSGDPSKSDMFTLAAKLPDGYTIAPHWYSKEVSIVVTSGVLMISPGDKPDESSMKTIGAGGFAQIPPELHHSAKAKGQTTIVISGAGPFAIKYVQSK